MALIDGFLRFPTPFTFQEMTHEVYWKTPADASGPVPAVLVIHELPGMTEKCLEFADRLVGAGFAVYLPLLFGEAGQESSFVNFVRVCVSREFKVFSQDESSPITNWLRALAKHVYRLNGHADFPSIGAIGMCLTGGFVLSLMLDETVVAPVASQPSVPFSIWPTFSASLGLSPSDLGRARTRAEQTGLMALRFERDWFCREERFTSLEREFGSNAELRVITAAECQRDGVPSFPLPPHAVFTDRFADSGGQPFRCTLEAFEALIAFFRVRLMPSGGPA
jgi:dienelactone hydrolase